MLSETLYEATTGTGANLKVASGLVSLLFTCQCHSVNAELLDDVTEYKVKTNFAL